jgi:hypothetical protein
MGGGETIFRETFPNLGTRRPCQKIQEVGLSSARLKEAKRKRAVQFIAIEQAHPDVSQSRKEFAATHDTPNGRFKQPGQASVQLKEAKAIRDTPHTVPLNIALTAG